MRFQIGTKKGRPLRRPPAEERSKNLERELRLQLNDPLRSIRNQTRTVDAGRRTGGLLNRAEVRRVVHVHNREIKVGVIEQVEEARAKGELRPLPLGNAERLLHRK